MARTSELLTIANFVLNVAGLKIESEDNEVGEGFKNIVDIETNDKVGQQPIEESFDLIEFEQAIIGWLCNYKFNEGF